LSGSRTVVDANVESVWMEGRECMRFGMVQKDKKVITLFGAHVEERPDMALGDDKTVSRRDGKSIQNPHGMSVLTHDAVIRNLAKRTGLGRHQGFFEDLREQRIISTLSWSRTCYGEECAG